MFRPRFWYKSWRRFYPDGRLRWWWWHFGAQFVKVGKCGTEHGVGRYITESALVIKLFQSGLYRGNIADDAILGESGQYLVKSIQRIFHGCRIDNQFGLEFFNLFECGISVGVVKRNRRRFGSTSNTTVSCWKLNTSVKKEPILPAPKINILIGLLIYDFHLLPYAFFVDGLNTFLMNSESCRWLMNLIAPPCQNLIA